MLPPIVTRFLAAHPGVTLEVAANDDLIDMVRDGFDAGVRYEERIERDMIAVPIGPRVQRFITAAAPAYLAAHGRPHTGATSSTTPASATGSPAAWSAIGSSNAATRRCE